MKAKEHNTQIQCLKKRQLHNLYTEYHFSDLKKIFQCILKARHNLNTGWWAVKFI